MSKSHTHTIRSMKDVFAAF